MILMFNIEILQLNKLDNQMQKNEQIFIIILG